MDNYKNSNINLEIIVSSKDEAIIAQNNGADILELVANIKYDSATPDLEKTIEITNSVNIPIKVMVQPKFSNSLTQNHFVYNEYETNTILQTIDFLKKHTNAKGVVFGCLNQNASVDIKLLEKVLKFADNNFSFTFHRAIDISNNFFDTYKQLSKYSEIHQILTSGTKETAIDGATIINQIQNLNQEQEHNKTIIPAAGITLHNIDRILTNTNSTCIHIGRGARDQNKKISGQKIADLKAILNHYKRLN